MSADDLKPLQQHFAFGANWADYAQRIDSQRIEAAEQGLHKLVAADDWQGRRVLDIGCGSGLHALAALRSGAAAVHAIDLDPDSVSTATALLRQHQAHADWQCEVRSVFDLPEQPAYDIVYSWGVLHHTGAMYEALQRAAAQVMPGGLLVFALYRKTRLCAFWKIEKRWYSRASAPAQRRAQGVYTLLVRLALCLRGRSFASFRQDYLSSRGMNFEHDVHDWLGGYPYESIRPQQVADFMHGLGFQEVRSFTRPGGWGWGGSGCDEYVYQRPAS